MSKRRFVMSRRVCCWCVLAGLTVTLLTARTFSAESTAANVLRAKKATALVELPRTAGRVGFGTAFCIDRSGLFVTNAHVATKAAGTMKLVLDAGNENQQVLSAKVVRVDNALDLALLRAENAAGLECLELGKVDQLVETASLAAYGYPFGTALTVDKGQYPSISVNLGRVTSLRQKQGALELIQLDAVLNPGNSGGPVLDSEGRVVGIVQAGLVGAGINFAIPVSRLETFLARPEVAVSMPSVSADRQHEPQEVAIQVVSFASPKPEHTVELTLSTGPNDVRIMTAKVEGGTAKLKVVPVPAPKQGIKQLRVTVIYASGSVVGQVADRDVKLNKQPMKLSQIRQIRFGDRKTVTLVNGKEKAGVLAGIDKLELNVGGTTIAPDLKKATAISIEDLEKPITSVSYKVVVKAGEKVVGETAGSIDLTGAVVAVSPAAASGAVSPPDVASLAGDVTTLELPGPIDDVVAGGAGRYLLFHLRKLQKLAIFDVTQAKIRQYLPLPSDDVLYAAGNEKLLLVIRDQQVIQRFDLATLKKELTLPLPEVGQVDGLALGHASAGPALLMTRNGPKFLDLAKLALVDLKGGVQGGNWHAHPQYPLQVRASADGSAFAAWEPGLSPSGIRLMILEGDSAQSRYEHNSAGILQPSYDGSLLFTSTGVYSADLKPLSPEEFRGVACFPSYHPAYFLGVSGGDRIGGSSREEKTKLSLYTTSDRRLLVSFTDFSELNDPRESPINSRGPLNLDKRVHFFPTANLLVNIPATRDRLVLRRLDVIAALEKAGIDYLYVASLPPVTAAPGSNFTYAIAVKSRRGGVRYKLDSGPEGMTLSSDGKLHWSVPAGQPTGRHGVIITIEDASGQTVLHSFNIAIR